MSITPDAQTAHTPTADELDRLEYSSSRRNLGPFLRYTFFWLAAAYTAFHLIILVGPVFLRQIDPSLTRLINLDQELFRIIHLTGGSVLGFGLYAITTRHGKQGIPWYDWLLIAGSIAIAVYAWINFDDLQMNAGSPIYSSWDFIYAAGGLAILFEFTRRTAGLALTIIAAIFMAYAMFGHFLPGVLYHDKAIRDLGYIFPYLYSNLGVMGTTLEVSSTFIIMFTAFAAFLGRSKSGDYFNDLSVALVGWARGGPAKAAVVSGIMFGSISGSSVANVVASGTITIPMMRRVGYDRATAGAVEATSSTGGQITPPVMGAGAFIMAEVTGIAYEQIALAAIIPCLLFYIACYAHCDLHARRSGLRGIPRNELPLLSIMATRIYMLAPIVVLVWAFIDGKSGFLAATLGMVAGIVVSWLNGFMRTPSGGMTWQWNDGVMGFRATAEALEQAARDCIQLVAVCAAAGIIVGVIALTGVGGRFAGILLVLAGESQLLALLFTMAVVILLGMGMPTTAAYAIGAAVMAPGLASMGVPKLVAHMFIFYYAVMSAITPPVAVASLAAAGMAQSDPWKTSWIAVKLGLGTLIVPFMFFYAPSLLGQGEWFEVAQVFCTAALGVVLLACSTEGWMNGPLIAPLRLVVFAAALCLMIPEGFTDIVGVVLAVAIFAYQRWHHGADPAAKIPSASRA
jgi:TRAP transporter 4TM/12TM fusion protein